MTDFDDKFTGPIGERFKKLIEWAAAEAKVNPGLLAVNLLAEERRSVHLRRGPVDSFVVGTDDFYKKRHQMKKLDQKKIGSEFFNWRHPWPTK